MLRTGFIRNDFPFDQWIKRRFSDTGSKPGENGMDLLSRVGTGIGVLGTGRGSGGVVIWWKLNRVVHMVVFLVSMIRV